MNREKRPPVIDEVQDFRKIIDHFIGIYGIYIEYSVIWQIMPKNLPGH